MFICNWSDEQKFGGVAMSVKLNRSKWIYARWLFLRLSMMLFDIVAVNVSFYLALLIRFYVANEFHSIADIYLEAYGAFAPYYTVICLLVFAGFKLYNSLWKYAGMNDMNRIIGANVVCAAFHVLGTVLFVRRMPVTYYCIGTALQFALIAGSRFSVRIVSFEANKLAKSKSGSGLNAMIVGSGETTRMLMMQMENGNVAHPVCILNYKGNSISTMMNGVQVLNGIENLHSALGRYKVNVVILADSLIPEQIRRTIRKTCEVASVEVQDFSGFLQNDMGSFALKNMMQYCDGEVELIVDGVSKYYPNAEQALMNNTGNYTLESIRAKEGKLVLTVKTKRFVLNDLNADWVKDQEKETGEEISFF